MTTTVAIVGGGVAGVWVGYKLAQAGISTVLITYLDTDRGGVQGSTARAVGSINTAPVEQADFSQYFEQLGRGVNHICVANALTRYLKEELELFSRLFEVKKIRLGLALASGSGQTFLQTMYRHFEALGGQILNAWVTRLVIDEQHCYGLQYQKNNGIGKILCQFMVLAAGGYASLYKHSLKTVSLGTLLGRTLACGGMATNLEFVFRHGYGQAEINDVTPTEQLAGAELYDNQNNRLIDLEQLFFNGQATQTHLRAVHYWRQHQIEHYVDLSYQPLFAQIDALNQHHGDIEHHAGFQTLIQSFPQAHQAEVKKKILAHQQISYETFEALKALYPLKARTVFKVKPLTYFSMGGLAHIQFKTNLKHVYVSGEMMHDFGANREGGLPWGLYLVSGRLIYEDILAQQALNSPHYRDFELIVAPAQFEHVLLADIQQRLHESQEQQFTVERAQQCIHWFRHTRQRLVEQHKTLDDGFAWLIVAEAIMLSTLCRQESRGYFFRPDKPKEDRKLDNLLSCVHYDRQHHQIIAQLLPWPLIHQALQK